MSKQLAKDTMLNGDVQHAAAQAQRELLGPR
jgi:hypothetical protein